MKETELSHSVVMATKLTSKEDPFDPFLNQPHLFERCKKNIYKKMGVNVGTPLLYFLFLCAYFVLSHFGTALSERTKGDERERERRRERERECLVSLWY